MQSYLPLDRPFFDYIVTVNNYEKTL